MFNVGRTSRSRGLNVDEFLVTLIKYEKSMFLNFHSIISGVMMTRAVTEVESFEIIWCTNRPLCRTDQIQKNVGKLKAIKACIVQ